MALGPNNFLTSKLQVTKCNEYYRCTVCLSQNNLLLTGSYSISLKLWNFNARNRMSHPLPPPLPDSYLEKKRIDNWMTRTYAIKLPYITRILQEIFESHMYLCDVR